MITVWNAILTSVQTYPVRWSSLFRCLVLLGTSFGLKLTSEQIASLMMAVEAGLAIFTHGQVTSNVSMQKTVEDNVAKIMNDSTLPNPKPVQSITNVKAKE